MAGGKSGPIDVPPDWAAAADAIAGEPGRCLILGAPDAGKTTFLRYLASRLSSVAPGIGIRSSQRRAVGWLSTDLGQPAFGPAASVNGGLWVEPKASNTVEPKASNTEDLRAGGEWTLSRPPVLEFVGALSPAYVLPELLAATIRALARLETRSPRWMVVDTSGCVQGNLGLRLKGIKITIFHPRHLLFLERRRELEAFRRLAQGFPAVIHQLTVSPRAGRRTPAERRQARERSFRNYFSGSRTATLSTARVVVWEPGGIFPGGEAIRRGALKDRLGALVGQDFETLGLCRILTVRGGEIVIESPVSELDDVRLIRTGRLTLGPQGAHQEAGPTL